MAIPSASSVEPPRRFSEVLHDERDMIDLPDAVDRISQPRGLLAGAMMIVNASHSPAVPRSAIRSIGRRLAITSSFGQPSPGHPGKRMQGRSRTPCPPELAVREMSGRATYPSARDNLAGCPLTGLARGLQNRRRWIGGVLNAGILQSGRPLCTPLRKVHSWKRLRRQGREPRLTPAAVAHGVRASRAAPAGKDAVRDGRVSLPPPSTTIRRMPSPGVSSTSAFPAWDLSHAQYSGKPTSDTVPASARPIDASRVTVSNCPPTTSS